MVTKGPAPVIFKAAAISKNILNKELLLLFQFQHKLSQQIQNWIYVGWLVGFFPFMPLFFQAFFFRLSIYYRSVTSPSLDLKFTDKCHLFSICVLYMSFLSSRLWLSPSLCFQFHSPPKHFFQIRHVYMYFSRSGSSKYLDSFIGWVFRLPFNLLSADHDSPPPHRPPLRWGIDIIPFLQLKLQPRS